VWHTPLFLFCDWGSKEVLLLGSVQCSKKVGDVANQCGTFPKEKKKTCEHTHELINMNHTTICSRWKENNICQSIWDKMKHYWELFGEDVENCLLGHPFPTPIKEKRKSLNGKCEHCTLHSPHQTQLEPLSTPPKLGIPSGHCWVS